MPGRSVHHIVPFQTFPGHKEANVLTNLVTLCWPCHARAEAKYWREHPDLARAIGYKRVTVYRACKFCGDDLPGIGTRTTICDACATATCLNCGKVFISRRATARAIKYCSVDCRIEHRRATAQRYRVRVCAVCGAEFSTKHRDARYCSQACHLTGDNPRRKFFARRARAGQA